ncbi:Alpha-2-macroglobulin precursor-like protein [Camelus ferus]|nr:Alpha-2-macroglobulin precursor-like protein [Camelus ferus]
MLLLVLTVIGLSVSVKKKGVDLKLCDHAGGSIWQYILWVSSVMQSHSPEQACLHLLNLNESVSLSVVLEYGGSNTTIFDQSVEEDNFYTCANFEVSQKSSEQLAFVTLLAKGDTLKIFERRAVAISSEETVTFVQTDKPIYKAGEDVKVRIVTLNTNFIPTEDLYPLITLQDPQNNRIFQWHNVTSFHNITELSFQLISEPMFGDYSIIVHRKSGKTLTHQFTVNRHGNQLLLVAVVFYEWHTFGQPVQGRAQIRVCREFPSSGNCEKASNEICEQFVAQLKFSGPNNVPMVNKLLQLELNDKFVGNYTTDENGEAQFSIDTSEMFDPEFSLKATYIRPKSCYLPSWLTPTYSEGYFPVRRFYSRTNSFLTIVPETKQLRCDQQEVVTVYYSLNSEAHSGDSGINFFYLIMVKGAIFLSGQKEIRNKAWKGNVSFPINVSADLAPVAFMLVYTLHPGGEIVADSVRFQVEKCFKNKVSMKFSKERRLPGSSTRLQLKAAPDSFCALRAVDKSVLLLKSEPQLSAETVYNLLPNTELYGYLYHGLNLDDGKLDPCIPQKDMFYNGLYYTPVSNHGDGDAYNIVRDMGLKVFTNLHHRKPEVCLTERGEPFLRPLYLNLGGYEPMYSAPSRIASGEVIKENPDYVEQAIIETVRTNFPETWIWDLVSVGSLGSANLSFVIPDTITQWEASGFCVNGEAGFGIASVVALEVSQPFFVEMTLPFSVVRNEQSDLIVSVFNYLNTCVEIFVQLEMSQDFEADLSTPKDHGSEIIQAGEKKTYIWTLTPAELGTKASRQVDLDLPNNVVEGSARAFFTIVGDVLGLAVQNLENLLQIPSGGGEQNIALLASDTYILDYLQSTEQLTEEVKSKAISFLSNATGKWLSALTFKTLKGMEKYIFIDEQVQKETLIWLSSKQKVDGCFQSDGKLFNNAWEACDAEDSGIILAACVLPSAEFPALRSGLFCLEEALENGVTNGYIHAVLAYAFALAGREKPVESLLQTLDQSATKLNNMIYWERAKRRKTEASPFFIPWAPSAETEKTCYVLLAVISQKTPDLTYASKIVQWLAQQMSPQGGFSYPQDTAVCLLAITRYMKLTFSNGQNTVTFSSDESSKVFQVNGDNRLLVQRSELTEAHGQHTVDVEGQGCTFIQATLRYNVLLPKKESGFSLSLEMVKKNSSDVFQSNFDLTVTLKYTGIRNNSNMVLVDVKMLSGFTPVTSSTEELENNGQVMKSEVKNDHILFYLENVFGTAMSFTFSVEQINRVSNIQPAPVMVYDYYEKGATRKPGVRREWRTEQALPGQAPLPYPLREESEEFSRTGTDKKRCFSYLKTVSTISRKFCGPPVPHCVICFLMSVFFFLSRIPMKLSVADRAWEGRQYLVVVPSQLYAGVPEKACVMLNHLNETVALTVTLEYETQSIDLLTDLEAKNSFYCRSFTIPELSSSSAFIIVQVKGPTQQFLKRKLMPVTKAESLSFVQTDKPIYKPGQTVKFRIVSMDVSFHPLDEMFPVVYIENPKRNRIFQWHSIKLQGGLNQQSFPLSEEPILGRYKVVLQKESGTKVERAFEVNEYVLPKFEVQVKMPKTIGFLDDEFAVSVCGLYTYGKPVPGLVTINVCRKYLRYSSACYGKYSQSICEEFSQQVLLVDEKDQPIPNKTVVVSVAIMSYQASFTTNEHGLVDISIDTTNFTSSFITVMVTYKQNNFCYDNWWLEESHLPAQHTARHVFSPSKSYVHLEPVAGTLACGQTQEVRAYYILNEQILKDEKELTFYYLIKARGSIAQSGTHALSIEQGELKGVFSFSFRVESAIAPTAQLLIYTVLPNGEVIADTEKLKIENCFANKVNLSFSSARSLPASDTNLKVTATPHSLCALRAVDQSVLLMKPEAELSPQSVYDLLPVKSVHSVRYRGPGNEDGEACITAEDITHNGLIYTPRQIPDDDVYSIFEVILLKNITKIDFQVFVKMENKWTSKL